MEDQKEKIKFTIKMIGELLKDSQLKWLIGGSGSLFVHGLDVTPNDIDIIADPADYESVKSRLTQYLTGETEPHGDTTKTAFKIEEMEGELLVHSIDMSQVTSKSVDGVGVQVYQLEVEYQFYKAREDKKESNRVKVQLIEKALGIT